MTYAKVVDGIVTEVRTGVSDLFVVKYRKTFKTFSLWIRVDQLNPVPAVGWHYDGENFSAP